jgi:hypothetical protein
MSVWRRVAALGLFLALTGSNAWAANPLLLNSTGTLSWFGFNVSASCSEGLNGAAATACTGSGANGLQLQAVPSGRGTVTFEIVNVNSGSAIFSGTALSGRDLVTVVLTFTPNGSYLPAGSTATTATLTTIGFNNCSFGSCSASASAAFSAGTGVTTLLDTLSQSTSSTAQNVSAGPNGFSTPSNAFTVTETLTDNPSAFLVTSLRLNSVALKLTTAPEPASITMILMGLSGLVMARRRRPPRQLPSSPRKKG